MENKGTEKKKNGEHYGVAAFGSSYKLLDPFYIRVFRFFGWYTKPAQYKVSFVFRLGDLGAPEPPDPEMFLYKFKNGPHVNMRALARQAEDIGCKKLTWYKIDGIFCDGKVIIKRAAARASINNPNNS